MIKRYPAKLLLLGEYSIILGSEALAIPLPIFSGRWKQEVDIEVVQKLQQSLSGFCDYLVKLNFEDDALCSFNVEEFANDLAQGYYFDSNVPQGYGVGSSGVLCAAVYDKYVVNKTNDASQLKNIFAKMEHFFHGASSGTDPLVCYLNKSVHIVDGKVAAVELPEDHASNHGFLLLDTSVPRNTDPLVTLFLQKSKDDTYRGKCEVDLIPAVSKTIEAVFNKNYLQLKTSIKKISDFQQVHFAEMIPEKFKVLWKIGENNAFIPKICGAGGGGYMLLYSWDIPKSLAALSNYKIQVAFRL